MAEGHQTYGRAEKERSMSDIRFAHEPHARQCEKVSGKKSEGRASVASHIKCRTRGAQPHIREGHHHTDDVE